MKKIFVMLAAMVVLASCACNSTKSEKDVECVADSTAVVDSTVAVVDTTVVAE